MPDLAFLQHELGGLERFLAEAAHPTDTKWTITHALVFGTDAFRKAATADLEAHGLVAQLEQYFEGCERPFWVAIAEPVPPLVVAIERRIERVLAAVELYSGQYESFRLGGDRGEQFPPR